MMGCCLTCSSDPCRGTTRVFWLGHWWSEVDKAYGSVPRWLRSQEGCKGEGTRDPDQEIQVITSVPPVPVCPGHPDPFPADVRARGCSSSQHIAGLAPGCLGAMEHRCVAAWEAGGGPLAGQHCGNTNASHWELCSRSLAVCDPAQVILLVKMMR